MKTWKVELLESINGIKFGTSRDEVRKILGKDFTEYKKSQFSDNTTDDYHFCHIYYDKNNTMEAIEIFNNIEIEIENFIVFPSGLEKLKELVDDLTFEDGYYFSEKYSIGVTMDEDRMDGILFGREKYYS